MPVDVIMPQMGESIAEGTLTTWIKKKGERVERDENLFEISTDKVDAEIPSPASGVLGEILVEEGQTVEVGTVVARILQEGEAPASGGDGAPASGEAEAAGGDEARTSAGTRKAGPAESQPDGAPSKRSEPQGEIAEAPAVARVEPAERGPTPVPEPAMAGGGVPDGNGGIPSKAELRRTRSSPLVRNIAAEHGVDLSRVEGTGLSGRVTKRDILAYVETRGATPSQEVPVEAAPAGPVERPTPERVGPAAVAAVGEGPRPFGDDDRVEIEPMSVMRKRIAEHMTHSRRTSAHVTSFFEFDLTRVAELRARNKPRFQAESGVNLTYMPFIIKAIVAGIKEWPILNASVWGDRIVYKQDINIGIAVALPQDRGFGLLVPVIRHADELSLVGLARSANDLAERARTKKLSPDEVQGGTFTITNPGVFGSLAGTPIINQPQVAIMGVGAIEKRVKVVGPNDAIGVRTCAYFSLSYDHRVVDGATADHFMLVVKETLEGFSDPSLK
ncbi:MAG TPA: dihydrolipoamide acetyltransferase family protein [Gemmatimonadota bacterium]|nr:dihydrolipoamide acetyltransferase family protein [Gemmatimonadota bacterium]